MSYLERLNWGEGDARIQRVFEHFYRQRGNVPNLFRVMGQRPALLTSFNAHFGAVMGDGEDSTVPILLRELLAVRVSQINDCEY